MNICAQEPTRILCIPAKQLETCTNPHAFLVRENLSAEMSKKIGVLTKTLSVVGEPRLSDRILAYLRTLPVDADGRVEIPREPSRMGILPARCRQVAHPRAARHAKRRPARSRRPPRPRAVSGGARALVSLAMAAFRIGARKAMTRLRSVDLRCIRHRQPLMIIIEPRRLVSAVVPGLTAVHCTIF